MNKTRTTFTSSNTNKTRKSMNKQELKSEQKRISAKIQGLNKIANISEAAELQIVFLSEELKWIEQQLAK